MDKKKLNEIDANLSAIIHRLSEVLKDPNDSLFLGESLEIQECMIMAKEAKVIIDNELRQLSVVVSTGTA